MGELFSVVELLTLVPLMLKIPKLKVVPCE